MRRPHAQLDVDWAGERWVLTSHRVLALPRVHALLVADMHLGKAAAFRASGVPVPEVIAADLALLAAAIDATSSSHLYIVGDLIHASHGRTAAVLEAFAAWRTARPGLTITLVRGNHDARAGDPPRDWRINVVNGPFRPWPDVEVELVHDPDREPTGRVPSIGGHLHPAVRLQGGMSSLRAPCFWVRANETGGADSMVMPAFGRFTGAMAIRPREGDRVFAVGPGEIAEVPTTTAAHAPLKHCSQ